MKPRRRWEEHARFPCRPLVWPSSRPARTGRLCLLSPPKGTLPHLLTPVFLHALSCSGHDALQCLPGVDVHRHKRRRPEVDVRLLVPAVLFFVCPCAFFAHPSRRGRRDMFSSHLTIRFRGLNNLDGVVAVVPLVQRRGSPPRPMPSLAHLFDPSPSRRASSDDGRALALPPPVKIPAAKRYKLAEPPGAEEAAEAAARVDAGTRGGGGGGGGVKGER